MIISEFLVDPLPRLLQDKFLKHLVRFFITGKSGNLIKMNSRGMFSSDPITANSINHFRGRGKFGGGTVRAQVLGWSRCGVEGCLPRCKKLALHPRNRTSEVDAATKQLQPSFHSEDQCLSVEPRVEETLPEGRSPQPTLQALAHSHWSV